MGGEGGEVHSSSFSLTAFSLSLSFFLFQNKSGGGLLSDHAYAMIKCAFVEGHRLVNIQNPWGELKGKRK